jgi:hypothetical protein
MLAQEQFEGSGGSSLELPLCSVRWGLLVELNGQAIGCAMAAEWPAACLTERHAPAKSTLI